MVFKVIILALAALGLIFVVGPFFNYSVFDFQCKATGCSGQICKSSTIFGSDTYTTCEYKPEYGCNKDCKSRNIKCSFDQDFNGECLKCIQDCETQFAFNKAVAEAKDTCFNACYNSTQN